MNAELRKNRMVALLERYLSRVGRAGTRLPVEQNDDECYTIKIGDTGIGVDTGHSYKVDTICGERPVVGYRTWVLKIHPGGPWHPDEPEDETMLEDQNEARIIVSVGELLARVAADEMNWNLPRSLEVPVNLGEPA